ncbi:hypothetical protein HY29_14400 [Hyphomonas beringensis]|uniref:CENP-V/GFA domain-containing protein n=1 Tax=Hyphomonas beringensis TaxID=1280946 RepID=A0A062U7S3_9PROT|nr:GFA family protein [Hyphomonas beringensis]KCZ54337.1 hypothetical protein HY29_14400 [Hyphomonas beringensis]
MKGQCLCGAVSLTVPDDVDHSAVGVCHCSMCQRWGGGPFFAIEGGQGITLDGREHVTAFRSSDWAERGFCSKCGTHLFYRLVEQDSYTVPAALFDAQDGMALASQIFIDEKPAYYDLSNDTPKLTGAQVFAAFNPEG